MLKDIQEAIESLEARIEAEEEQIRLMKNDLRALKERLPQGTEITGAKSLPESLDELFRQFFIQNDTRGLIKRVDTVLARKLGVVETPTIIDTDGKWYCGANAAVDYLKDYE